MVVFEWESDIHVHEESCDCLKAAVRCMRSILHTCACIIHEREDFGKFLMDRQVD